MKNQSSKTGIEYVGNVEELVEGVIGKSWELGASGPFKFDCWGIVEYVITNATNLPMPSIEEVAMSSPFAYAKAFKKGLLEAEGMGWERVAGRSILDMDVLCFGRPAMNYHCGIAIKPKGKPASVLHSMESCGVVVEPFKVVTMRFSSHEVLRFSR